METLDDVVARDRRSQALAVRAAGEPERAYTYHRFCTTAWKTGNFLRHLGVREGVTVGIADDPLPQPLLGVFGATLLGATARFAPPDGSDLRAVLARTGELDRYDLPPGGQRVGYGDRPDDPADRYFEKEVWSENPSFPPVEREPGASALATGGRTYSHEELVDAALEVVDEHGIDGDETVAVRAPLAEPGTVVAGVIAPLIAGATVLFPGEDETGDLAVGDGGAPEPRSVAPISARPE